MAAGAAPRAVLVMGAHGVLGTALVRTFEDAGWRVVRGVRRSVAARDSTVVDLDRPETVAAAIAGVDLVVDPVPHPELTAERVVLREGGVLIDVSMRPVAATRRLREETTSARGTVVLNAGPSGLPSGATGRAWRRAPSPVRATTVSRRLRRSSWRRPCWIAGGATACALAASTPRSCSPCPSWRRTSGNGASP